MTAEAPARDTQASALKTGLACGFAAYLLWGLMPIYLKTLPNVSAVEIVAHRIVWSVPFGALIIAYRRQWRETLAAFRTPRVLALLTVTSLMIAANWLLYVWAVAHDQVLQASLGYYINPLVFIAAGVVLLGERLNRLQVIAIVLAAAGVATLTIGAGEFPLLSILLAVLFTGYGIVRKTTPVGAMPGLFVETTVLSAPALLYLFATASAGGLAFGAQGAATDMLLVLAGPVTVVPLLLFALAARRLRLTTLGFIQYIAPTGQFLLGLYYGEPFTLAHAICFGLIWTGLALVSFDAVRTQRQTAVTGRA